MKNYRSQIPSQYAGIGSPDGSDVNQSVNVAVVCHSMGCVGMLDIGMIPEHIVMPGVSLMAAAAKCPRPPDPRPLIQRRLFGACLLDRNVVS
jgi:hypothetical protein